MLLPSCSFLILSALCPLVLAIECFRARTALPVLYHCQDLVDAIASLARQPGENDVKAWGRRLPATKHTETLPKLYYTVGQVLRTTCAVKVDVDREDSFAVDDFRQSDIARTAERVVGGCLRDQRLIGLDYPSEAGHVYVMVIRVDARVGLEIPGAHDVRNVSLPGMTSVLQIVEGTIAVRERALVGGDSPSSHVDD